MYLLNLIFISALLLRLVLAFLPGFEIDLNDFRFWSLRISEIGPWNFYNQGVFADYAPGYLYILGILGLASEFLMIDPAGSVFIYLLKIAPIIFDLGSAYLIYKCLANQKKLIQIAATAIYLLHPAVLFIGPIWGQIDSALTFFLLLVIYYLMRKRPIPASLALTMAFWIKPQAIAVLPFFLFVFFKNYSLKTFARACLYSILLSFAVILPFFPTAPWRIIDTLASSAEVYPYTSFFAYNFWALFGMFKPDSLTFLGLSLRLWGIILFFLSLIPIPLLIKKISSQTLSLGFAISVLTFFLFTTRMHERYLFTFIALFLLFVALKNSKYLWLLFGGISLIHLGNLYAAYAYYNHNFLRIEPIFSAVSSLSGVFSILTLLTYAILVLSLVKSKNET